MFIASNSQRRGPSLNLLGIEYDGPASGKRVSAENLDVIARVTGGEDRAIR